MENKEIEKMSSEFAEENKEKDVISTEIAEENKEIKETPEATQEDSEKKVKQKNNGEKKPANNKKLTKKFAKKVNKTNKKSKRAVSIKIRLAISLLLIILVFIASSVFNFYQLQIIDNNMQKLEQQADINNFASQLSQLGNEIYNCFTDLYVFGDKTAKDRINGTHIQFKSALNSIKTRTSAEEQRKLKIEQIETSAERLIWIFENQLLPEYNAQNEVLMRSAINSADSLMLVLNEDINDLLTVAKYEHRSSRNEILSALDHSINSYILGLGVVIVVSFIISIFLYSSISKPIKNLINVSNTMAQGDLSVELTEMRGKGEVAMFTNAFKEMQENIRALIKQVLLISETLGVSSSQLASNAEETSNATSQVAATIEQLSAGSQNQQEHVNEAVEFVKNTALNIDSVNQKSIEMSKVAEVVIQKAQTGKETMENMENSINIINDKVISSATMVSGLKEQSQQISNFVGVISDIAEQTNLLALNAAIEAARAGEQGRGFAVVAEEVRKLAEQSNDAASEISHLVNKIQAETDAVVLSMQESTEEVKNGSKVVVESGKQFMDIFQEVNNLVNDIKEIEIIAQNINNESDRMVEAIDNISAITEEASAGLEEVSATTEEQTASVQEVSSAAQELAELAQKLQEAVQKFKV